MNKQLAGLRLVAIVLSIVIVILAAVFIIRQRMASEVPQTAPAQPIMMPAPAPAPVPGTATALPDSEEVDHEETPPVTLAKPEKPLVAPPDMLDGSDVVVKKVIEELAPAMLEWLASEHQVRKWVMSVDLMADGNVPKQYRPLSYPMAPFSVDTKGTAELPEYYLSAENFLRTDKLIAIVTAMDAKHVADYYQTWLPLLEKAYREQGKADRFDFRFRKALKRIVAVKPLPATPALVKKGGVMYAYADSQLENATDVEKMIWCLGPDNGGRLQAWVKQVLEALPAPLPKKADASGNKAP